MHKQHTLAQEITFNGIGVHNGQDCCVTLKAAPANTGIEIHRSGNTEVMKIGTIVPQVAMHATVLVQGSWKVSTIEHVLAALAGLGVDNAIVELSGDEAPILDGSSAVFVKEIEQGGVVAQDAMREYLTPTEVITFEDKENNRLIEIHPAQAGDTSLHIEYEADFDMPGIEASKINCTLDGDFFAKEIAPARTFGFYEQLPYLQKHGLAQGASLDNTLVIKDGAYVNEPRFSDECVRHKLLDLIGDLYLLGKPLAGKVVARRTGHSFNRLVVEHKLAHPGKWQKMWAVLPVEEPEKKTLKRGFYKRLPGLLAVVGFFVVTFVISGRRTRRFHQAIVDGNEVVVRELLPKLEKSDFACYKDGSTSLHVAVDEQHVGIVRALLRTDIDVNAVNAANDTALYRAAHLGNLSIVSALLDAGAQTETATAIGLTALHIAVAKGHGEIVDLLLKHGASVDVAVAQPLEERLSAEAQRANQMILGSTPLLLAYSRERIDIMTSLLKHGASPNVFTNASATLLHDAASRGKVEAARVLLSYGASMNAALQIKDVLATVDQATLQELKAAGVLDQLESSGNDYGLTPLMAAVMEDQPQMVTLLLESGAAMNDPTAFGSPLYLAKKKNKTEIIEILQAYDAASVPGLLL